MDYGIVYVTERRGASLKNLGGVVILFNSFALIFMNIITVHWLCSFHSHMGFLSHVGYLGFCHDQDLY